MNLKQTMRYQLHETVRPTIIYYLVMLCLLAVSLLAMTILRGVHNARGGFVISGSSSADMASAIFLFVLGLNMFKSPFAILTQNGISRRTQWTGLALVGLGLTLAVALIDSLYPLALSALNYTTSFAGLYQSGSYRLTLTGLAWNWTAYLAAFTFGFFLTTLYYRMSKPLKVGVSIGVPVLLFFVLPMLEVFIPSFNLFTSLMKAVAWLLGFDLITGQTVPLRAVASFTGVSVLSLGLAWLLMRRAVVRE